MLDWPFKSTSSTAVQGVGFYLAIIGLVISVVGFAITLIQLNRTKRATTAVSDEVQRIRFAVMQYDAAIEASRAEALLGSIRKFVRNADWQQANDHLESFGKSLHTLIELKIPQIQHHDIDLEKALSHTLKLSERLDKAGNNGLTPNETIKTLSSIRDNERLITSIGIALGRSALSE